MSPFNHRLKDKSVPKNSHSIQPDFGISSKTFTSDGFCFCNSVPEVKAKVVQLKNVDLGFVSFPGTFYSFSATLSFINLELS